MSDSIEFHDSTLIAVAVEGTSVRIDLDAYVHRWQMVDGVLRGAGWVRPVRILLSDATGDNPSGLPLDLHGGVIRAGQMLHCNLVPLPFRSSEPTRLLLDTADGPVEFAGRSVIIEATGEGRYMEALPDDFAPSI